LGQIHQAAQRDDQAELCFQRALYLEPNSYKALVHLALLKEYQGDQAGAKVIRQRIQRLQHVCQEPPPTIMRDGGVKQPGFAGNS
jgi:chemotaxis protein methyltransferase WspC